jgi:hypothetical protein
MDVNLKVDREIEKTMEAENRTPPPGAEIIRSMADSGLIGMDNRGYFVARGEISEEQRDAIDDYLGEGTLDGYDGDYTYPEALVAGLGAGLGFLLAMVLFSGVRRRVEEAVPPESFRGMPITLISAAIVAMSFMGFSGVIDHLFGA